MKTRNYLNSLMCLGLLALPIHKICAGTAVQTAQEINAQTNITKSSIDNLLDKINSRKVDSNFRATDYLAQAEITKKNIEASMKKFETTLKDDILAKASFWMDQYNSIYNSNNYSKDQKDLLLKERLKNITNQFEKLSLSYQSAINEVYGLIPYGQSKTEYKTKPEKSKLEFGESSTKEKVKATVELSPTVYATMSFEADMKYEGYYDYFLNFNYSGESLFYSGRKTRDRLVDSLKELQDTKRIARCIKSVLPWGDNTCYWDLDYAKLVEKIGSVNHVLKKQLFQMHFYPEMREKCQSSICLGLVSADYVNLLVMIRKLIDRPIELTLADGNIVKLVNVGKDISFLSDIFSIVDYPEELPFDI